PTPTSFNNFKATHSATISKDIHTDSQLQIGKTRKTAVLGRVPEKSRLQPRIQPAQVPFARVRCDLRSKKNEWGKILPKGSRPGGFAGNG
ncbi:MAG: hypothetical protein WAV72_29295, partial [Bradyrhizobium sp.]